MRCIPMGFLKHVRPGQCFGGGAVENQDESELPVRPVNVTAGLPSATPSSSYGLQTGGSTPSVCDRGENPEQKRLPQVTYRMTHSDFGSVHMTREPKPRDSKIVAFKIRFQSLDEKVSTALQTVSVSQKDENYDGVSTLGSEDFNLGEVLQGKGVGTLLLYAIANASAQLGTQKVVVDNVIHEGPMFHLCEKIGMQENGAYVSYYSGDAGTISKSCLARLENKGWKVMPPVSENTPHAHRSVLPGSSQSDLHNSIR